MKKIIRQIIKEELNIITAEDAIKKLINNEAKNIKIDSNIKEQAEDKLSEDNDNISLKDEVYISWEIDSKKYEAFIDVSVRAKFIKGESGDYFQPSSSSEIEYKYFEIHDAILMLPNEEQVKIEDKNTISKLESFLQDEIL